MPEAHTLTLASTAYRVERTESPNIPYRLHTSRATYPVMRNVNTPGLLCAVVAGRRTFWLGETPAGLAVMKTL